MQRKFIALFVPLNLITDDENRTETLKNTAINNYMDGNIVLTTMEVLQSCYVCFLCVKNEIVRIIARQIKYNCLVISKSLRSSETRLVNKQSTVFCVMRDTHVTKDIFNNISNFSQTWRNACSVSFLSTATAAMATLPRVPQASRFKAAKFASSEILKYVFSRKVRSRRFLSPSYPWTIWGSEGSLLWIW